MLSSFQVFNLQPRPELFDTQTALVWALIASLYVGNVMLLVLNLPLIRLWVKVLEIPRPALYSGILLFGTLGVYSISNSVTEVLIMYTIGALGFFMRRADFPIAPVILGVILGPLMEAQFRRTLIVSDGDLSALVSRPLSIALLVLAVLAVFLPYLPTVLSRMRGRPATSGRPAFGDED
jgi:putative tricarboxylic transport membrane protein